jgi:hypothetical protein
VWIFQWQIAFDFPIWSKIIVGCTNINASCLCLCQTHKPSPSEPGKQSGFGSGIMLTSALFLSGNLGP